ncbi:hypothetical protein GCM10011611_24870 [Aliidongia dinghuensis]|uniref:Protein ImuA n=1 Tax=Aliidongia dinghuensis TaxID=1867774 RepID=A0A8J2YTW2_9PROT|nr:damage-inducible protein [Aliidongia dinghuensis]GGF18058.1 hypothetical protein GCM10011611_24870 [Aliidongia dinghuensis]
MKDVRQQALLAELRARVRAQEMNARRDGPVPTLPFGVPELDAVLPSGGLMLGAVHEVLSGGPDLTHATAAVIFVAGILARTCGTVIWAFGRRDLFAPALAGVGLHPDRVIYVEAGDSKGALLVMEEALRYAGLAGVVGEIEGKVDLTGSRRLQLAAEGSGGLGLMIRRPRRRGDDITAEPTAARTRWSISAIPSPPALEWSPDVPGVGPARWRLDLVRCRGGEPKSFIVGACDETGRLGLPAGLADRQGSPNQPQLAVG